MSRSSPSMSVSRPELLVDGSDAEFRQMLHDTLAFAAQIQEIRNNLGAAIGLSGAQYTILMTVAHGQDAPDGLGINQVAAKLHLSGAFVTIEVNRLVAAGLVEKQVNPEDRRRVLLSTTAKGRALLVELRSLQQPVNDALFDGLSRTEFQRLRALMAKLVLTGEQSLNLVKFLASNRIAAGR
ncbi:MarR family winged helix-turn-helix transcriptional regulator [Roseomonas sp. NAR14]|uniref:MarR family winged helix-turn-helix transcriptional regulator n=1 Tax=Roseomonas acroporae TaxID=2937791 RepID=A0A9X2BUR9_9PROT|nr:MarR family winged helix-turn-helix transcriptional regulator [Roseomonas acroporae]MCK8784421.1 MarR family winged helix-turn-helix transcriptional regulator [Roseomonas acroporae]